MKKKELMKLLINIFNVKNIRRSLNFWLETVKQFLSNEKVEEWSKIFLGYEHSCSVSN